MKKLFLGGFILGTLFTLVITNGWESSIQFFQNVSAISKGDTNDSNTNSAIKNAFLREIGEKTEILENNLRFQEKLQSEEIEILYGIQLGNSQAEVLRLLGEPNRKDASHIGVEWWVYNDDTSNYFQVGFKDQEIVTLYSNGEGWKYSGLKQGSTLQEIRESLGEPEESVDINPYVTILGNGFDKKVVYKRNNEILLLYLDTFDENKIMGIRLFTTELFAKLAFLLEYKVSYTSTFDYSFPPLNPEEIEKAELAYEKQIYDLTNVIRIRNGLPTLTYNSTVAAIAKSHSLDMYENQFFDHVSPTSGTLKDRFKDSPLNPGSFGENLAAGYMDGVDAVAGWMNSEGHRINLLNNYATEIGIGVILGNNDRFNTYYTQNFYSGR